MRVPRVRGRKPHGHAQGGQGHSLLLTVREVQVHLELKIDFTQGLFHLQGKQSSRDFRSQVWPKRKM